MATYSKATWQTVIEFSGIVNASGYVLCWDDQSISLFSLCRCYPVLINCGSQKVNSGSQENNGKNEGCGEINFGAVRRCSIILV